MAKKTQKRYITLDEYTFAISMVTSGAALIEMLHKSKQQVDAMLSYYSKVFVVGITVHPTHITGTNESISSMMRDFRKAVTARSSRYNFLRYGYAWFREAPNGDHTKHHYHLVLMLDGHKIRNPTRLLHELLIPLGRKAGLGLCIADDDQSFMLTRLGSHKYDSCLYQLSYFSKESGKGHQAPSSNNYSTSRLKPNPMQKWKGFKNRAPRKTSLTAPTSL